MQPPVPSTAVLVVPVAPVVAPVVAPAVFAMAMAMAIAAAAAAAAVESFADYSHHCCYSRCCYY